MYAVNNPGDCISLLLLVLACAPWHAADTATQGRSVDRDTGCAGLPAVLPAPDGFVAELGDGALVAFGEICDPSQARTPAYAWALSATPEGSGVDTGDLTIYEDDEHSEALLTADVVGTFVVSVVVSDPEGNMSAPGYWSVTQGTGNQAPIADCGGDVDAAVGDAVTLDGSGSYDPESASLSFSWNLAALPACSALESGSASIRDPSSATAGLVADCVGTYVVSLTVTDEEQDSAPDSCTVTAL